MVVARRLGPGGEPGGPLWRSSARPWHTLQPWWVDVYDWLEANGVHEILPPSPLIRVQERTLTYSAYSWPVGVLRWDVFGALVSSDPCVGEGLVVAERTVPLRVSLTAAVRAAAAGLAGGLTLEVTR